MDAEAIAEYRKDIEETRMLAGSTATYRVMQTA
jgi:hypothetical protein